MAPRTKYDLDLFRQLVLSGKTKGEIMAEMAIKNQDADTLFHIAHKMKSSCGSIGAFGLAEKAEVLELIGRRGSTQDSNEACAELQSSLEEVLTLLKEEMN